METVLIVDDEIAACNAIGKALGAQGYAIVKAYNGRDALEVLDEKPVDVVLLDIRMPFMDGMEALVRIKDKYGDVAVLMVSANTDIMLATECMQKGAYGYISKPINLELLTVEIKHAIGHSRLERENREYRKDLEKKVEQRTEQVQQLLKQLQRNFYSFIKMFIEVQSLYDPLRAGHSQRVAYMAEKIGKRLNLEEKVLSDLQIAALFHDLGLIGLSEKVRFTPFSHLNDDERALVKKQTIMTQEVLASIPNLHHAGEIIRSHLERVDGTGIPDGLSGDAIPLESRILSVVNAYDEMCHFRRFMGKSEYLGLSDDQIAAIHLRDFTGKKFDKRIVDLFFEIDAEEKGTQTHIVAVAVDDLKEGMILADDMKHNGKLIMTKGNKLTPMQVEFIRMKLRKAPDAGQKINVFSDKFI